MADGHNLVIESLVEEQGLIGTLDEDATLFTTRQRRPWLGDEGTGPLAFVYDPFSFQLAVFVLYFVVRCNLSFATAELGMLSIAQTVHFDFIAATSPSCNCKISRLPARNVTELSIF